MPDLDPDLAEALRRVPGIREDTLVLEAKPWELLCPICWRSSWDGRRDDDGGEPCAYCGQLPALADA
jgi:hypothetical protein